jgi:hypothetical protein
MAEVATIQQIAKWIANASDEQISALKAKLLETANSTS